MDHHFDVELACEVGTDKAIILHNIVFWIHHNIANEVNEHDGHFWTYNTAEAFGALMPYLKPRAIARCIRELESDGYLISSDKYSDNQWDKTKWYTLGDKMDKYRKLPEAKTHDNNETIDCKDMDTRLSKNGQSNNQKLPLIKGTDIKPNSKPDVNQIENHSFLEKSSPNNKGEPITQMTTIERKEYLKDSIRRVKIRETG